MGRESSNNTKQGQESIKPLSDKLVTRKLSSF